MGSVTGRRRRGRAWASVLLLAMLVAFLTGSGAAASSAPDLTVTASSNASGPVALGDVFTYTVVVSNVGTAVAHDVQLEDDLPVGLLPTTILPDFPGGQCTVAGSQSTGQPPHYSVHCDRTTLGAGASVSVSFEVEVTRDADCGALTNTVTVQASDEPATAEGNDGASVTDTVTCPPSVSISKTAPAFAHVGDLVHLSMMVRNGGGPALSHVRVVDPGCRGAPSLGSSGNGDQILDPGEVWRYGCAIRITPATGRVLATAATVTARSYDGGVRASDRATVRVLRPDVTIRATTSPISGAAGDPITYRFVVRNIGDSTLTSLSIDDDQLGHIGSIPTLVPGHDAVVSTVRVLSVRHVWVTDTATVTGSDPSGSPVRATDQAVVTIVDAGTQPSSGGTGGGTAFTGSSTTVPAGAAVVLMIAGLAALLAARRRRS